VGLDVRTTRPSGYRTSLQIWKRVEEIFGWIKTVGGLRRSRHRRQERTQAWSYLMMRRIAHLAAALLQLRFECTLDLA